MQILSVNDNEFKKYGRVVDNVDFTELIQELKRTPIPSGVVYEPAVKELEALPIRLDISSVVYGEMPIQIGYCNGHNSKLNALEYHRDSEINIAAVLASSSAGTGIFSVYDSRFAEVLYEALSRWYSRTSLPAVQQRYAPVSPLRDGGFRAADRFLPVPVSFQ